MSVRIDYGGVVSGAKDDFIAFVSEEAYFSNHNQLQQDNLKFLNYGNPCELYSVLLDGGAKALPSNTIGVNVGWCSNQTSGSDGVFETPIIAEFVANNLYTSNGISLTFDEFNDIYSNDLTVTWYRDDSILANKTFVPDNAFYFCQNKVEFYNKVVISFRSINMPYNRLRLRAIDYGIKISFDGSELENVKIIQELNPISAEIASNTCDFVLNSRRNIEFVFEETQPVNVYFNGKLKSKSFVKSSRRKSKTVWAIQTEDYIGMMGRMYYHGGVFAQKKATDLLKEIFDTAQVPCQIDEVFADEMVTGYIPYTTCREALMQVAFAIQAAVDTSGVDYVKVFKANMDLTQNIPLNRIMQGQEFSEPSAVTSVEVISHDYIKTNESLTVYDTNNTVVGTVHLVFSEPLHSLSISNGEILESSENHAVIVAEPGCVLVGKKYAHTTMPKNQKNPNVLSTASENIVSVKEATLVSSYNVDKILDACYNYYVNNKTINLKIVDGKHKSEKTILKYGQARYGSIKYGGKPKSPIMEDDIPTNVGDVVNCETEYLGVLGGIILRQSFVLNGGITIKDTVIKRT